MLTSPQTRERGDAASADLCHCKFSFCVIKKHTPHSTLSGNPCVLFATQKLKIAH